MVEFVACCLVISEAQPRLPCPDRHRQYRLLVGVEKPENNQGAPVHPFRINITECWGVARPRTEDQPNCEKQSFTAHCALNWAEVVNLNEMETTLFLVRLEAQEM